MSTITIALDGGNGLSISDTLVPPFRDGPHRTDPIKIAQETRVSTALLLARWHGNAIAAIDPGCPQVPH